jgi:DHA1 family multidrug resistance protein-like MFS transporter
MARKYRTRQGGFLPTPKSTLSWKSNLIALFAAQTCVMIAFSFVFPFIPLYVRDLGVTNNADAARWAGAISAAAAVTMAFAQPVWGNLADRYGRRIMVLRSIGAAGVTLTLMGFVNHPWQLLVLRFLQGAFTGTVAASNALIATSVPRDRLGSSLGLMQVALFVGTALGPLVGGVIADWLGFRTACFAAGILMVLAFVLVSTLVRENFTPPPADAPHESILADSRKMLAVPGLLMILVVTFLIQFGASVVAPVLALFIHELTNAKNAASAAGVIMAGTGVASAFAAVTVGRLGDKLGHRRVLPVCLLGAALTCLPQAYVHGTGELFAWRFILGLFLGGLMPSATALLANLVPSSKRGSAFGLAGTSLSLANAAGPLTGAFLGGALGMGSVFLATSIFYFAGFAFVLSSFRRLPKRGMGGSQPTGPVDPEG